MSIFRAIAIVAVILLHAACSHAQLRIAEFMAVNTHTILDGTSNYADWIEIENPGTSVVHASGYFLTDDPRNLVKWRCPDLAVPPGGFLIVFASGIVTPAYIDPAGFPHATFKLEDSGEYLALVAQDGVTILTEFAPMYPPQYPDVSYGSGIGKAHSPAILVAENTQARMLVPTNYLGSAWQGGAEPYDDSAWTNAAMPAGFNLEYGPETIAYRTPANTPGMQSYTDGLGMDFVVTRPVTLSHLGCFDDMSDGLKRAIDVRLFARDDRGTPTVFTDDLGTAVLATVYFPTNDPGQLEHGNRFKPLTSPLVLQPGAYSIVALGYGSTERNGNTGWGFPVPYTGDSGGALTFVGNGRYGGGGAFPPVVDGLSPAAYGAGTFKFRTNPDAAFATSLASLMFATNATMFARIPFVASSGVYAETTLTVGYDDGFVSFLNGTEVARRNAPTSLSWNATASISTNATDILDLTPFLATLLPGSNILAFHGLNVSATDTDFRASVVLTADMAVPTRLYFTVPTPGTTNGPGVTHPRVSINEIHCDPPHSKTYPVEFIELHNPLDVPVNMAGWRFSRGISFTFPSGATISPHGYALIAADPSACMQRFGVAPWGPWSGNLANDGETLELLDAASATVDRIEYRIGFPWPTVGDEPETSIQLVHDGLDNSIGGNWRSASPTPGILNGPFLNALQPALDSIGHSPLQPLSSQPVLVTALVARADFPLAVALHYQVVLPGQYIRATDPAFATNWMHLPMHDDGAAGDLVARDFIYSAQIPASVNQHRRLVRYRVTATNASGSICHAPYPDDPALNFAFFVYDGEPAWTGAVQPGVSLASAFGTNITRAVPSFHLVAQEQDILNSQYNTAYGDELYHFEGALVVGSAVYDHMPYRVRGQNSTYVTGKNKWKFKFNRGHWFHMPDNYGSPYSRPIHTLNIGPMSAPWAPWNRGIAGLDEAVAYRLYNLAGVSAPHSSYFQFRIIDTLAEAYSTNQYEGDLWGLYLAFEEPDNQFKDQHHLPDGNIFRMQTTSGGNRLNGQGKGQPDDLSDLNAFVSTSTGYNRPSLQPLAWWRTNVDLPGYYSWRAITEAINNTDIRDQENVMYFRNPTNGLWSILPWDCDLLYEQFDRWGPEGVEDHVPYEQIRRCVGHAALSNEFKNRARELQDLLLNTNQIPTLVAEMLSFVTEGGAAQPGFVEVDRRMWDWHPRTRSVGSYPQKGNFYRTPFSIPNMGYGPPQPFYRTLASGDFPGQVAYVTSFIVNDPHGGARLASLAADATIPVTPTLLFLGASNYPLDQLVFATTGFTSPASRTCAAVQWRVGEVFDPHVTNFFHGVPWRYEIDAVWLSSNAGFAAQTTVPPEILSPGRTFRARVRHQDSAARWSHWSPAIEFVPSPPTTVNLLSNLVVSEIMYNPAEGADLEFIELRNICPTASLDLTAVQFTEGVMFSFTNGTTLAPGSYTLVVRSIAAFTNKYGHGMPIAGEYLTSSMNSLDNGGERIVLSYGSAMPLRDFAYDDDPPWPVDPDGLGPSLVLRNPDANPDHALPINWRPSYAVGGSPGSHDTLDIGTWRTNSFGPDIPSDPLQETNTWGNCADPDHDGWMNLAEFVLASNPTNASSRPVFLPAFSDDMLHVFYSLRDGATGAHVHVEFSNAATGPWVHTGIRVPPPEPRPGIITIIHERDASPAALRRHARLLVEPD